MDRIGGVGDDGHVTGIGDGLDQVDVALFAPHGRHRFGLGIQDHIVFAQIPVGDRQTELVDPFGGAVAVDMRFTGGLHQLLDHRLEGRTVGITHREIHHIGAGTALRHLQLVDDSEDILGKPVDLVKLYFVEHFYHTLLLLSRWNSSWEISRTSP